MPNLITDQLIQALGVDSDYELTELAGNANDNFLIQIHNRKIVVKCLGEHIAENEELEGAYRQYFVDKGLPVNPFLTFKNGEYVFSSSGHFYVALDYVEGSEARGEAEAIVEQIAIFMANLHTLDYEQLPIRVNWLNSHYVDHIRKEVNLKQNLVDKLKKYDASFPDFWSSGLPKGIIHGDLHEGNIIIDSNQKIISIIDWEEVSIEPLVLDIAGTVQSLCQNEDGFDEDVFNKFFKAYQSIRLLTDAEKQVFDEALRYRSFIVFVWSLMKYKQGLMHKDKFNYFMRRYENHPKVPVIE